MSGKKATRRAYGEYLVHLGKKYPQIVVLDADLADATFTKLFKEEFPERFFDCGIAEANMIDMAAGLSTMGLIPFASTFAVFGAGRAYEQIRNGIAYSGLNVKLAFSHAGVSTGPDGGSHQSIEDIALMRVIPGMTVIVPADEKETMHAMDAALEIDGPVYIRLARMETDILEDHPFQVGHACVLKHGSDVALICCGITVDQCLAAARALEKDGISAAVINMHTIKPLDAGTVLEYAKTCKKIITVEDHSVIGGLGDAVASVLCGRSAAAFEKLGVQDRFGQSATPDELMHEYGIDADCIIAAAKRSEGPGM